MKKKVIMLSCIAAVAIATFVGTKALQSNAYENGLLTQNVEALSKSESGKRYSCYYLNKYKHGGVYRNCITCEYDYGAPRGSGTCYR